MVTPDLTKKFSAGKIINEIAPIMDGGGSGKAEMAHLIRACFGTKKV